MKANQIDMMDFMQVVGRADPATTLFLLPCASHGIGKLAPYD